MSFAEVNLFGIYVAPVAPMLALAWAILFVVRRLTARFGLLNHVWHPALFLFALYLILLSSIVVLAGEISE
jgi:hypothetical protein